MKKTLIALLAVFALSGLVSAQSAITGLTITEPASVLDQAFTVSSATGISANVVIYVDGEFVTVAPTYVSGTRVPVIRQNPAAHLDNAQGYIVPPGARAARRYVGACVRGTDPADFTLIFDFSNSNIGRCAGAVGSRTWRWTNAYDTGTPSGVPPTTP